MHAQIMLPRPDFQPLSYIYIACEKVCCNSAWLALLVIVVDLVELIGPPVGREGILLLFGTGAVKGIAEKVLKVHNCFVNVSRVVGAVLDCFKKRANFLLDNVSVFGFVSPPIIV